MNLKILDLLKARCMGVATFALLAASPLANAEEATNVENVRLPKLLTDHMILQQNAEVTLWGWTTATGATVDIETSWGAKTQARSDSKGEWRARLQTPAARSLDKGLHPESITFTSGNKVALQDILIGEVWLCSGQSNMEMYAGWDPPVQRNLICGDDSWNHGESAKADRPGLRLPQQTCRRPAACSASPGKDLRIQGCCRRRSVFQKSQSARQYPACRFHRHGWWPGHARRRTADLF